MSEFKLLIGEIVDHIRSIISIKVLMLVCDIAPKSRKDIYVKGVDSILSQLYCHSHFCNICIELGLDPYKVVESNNSAVIAIAQAFARKELDEVGLMRSLRNLSILNGEQWKA